MFLRSLLSHVLAFLLPLAIASTVYLYLYPVFHGCAFPLPPHGNLRNDLSSRSSNAFFNTVLQHVAPDSADRDKPADFRLLVLADPQLEGDSSLPDPDDGLFPRIRKHWDTIRESVQSSDSRDVLSTVFAELRSLAIEDVPRTLRAAQKRLDLFGNDYYLAHIYRTLHWWSRPTHVTVLGDLIGSQWVTDGEFDNRGGRYWNRVFKGGERVGDGITVTGARDYNGEEGVELDPSDDSAWTRRIINIAGNHDIGYSGDVSQSRIDRFERAFGRANWDVRFRYHLERPGADNSTAAVTPTLHLINLNTLTLDGPALSQEIQSDGYTYINRLISHRTYPVEDRTTFTLLLTHLPLHKSEGICTDGPYFTFHETDDGDGPDGIPRFKAGGLREQNHLSEHVSANGVLEGIFGMSGNEEVPGGGRGRNGLILTGHDHTGCDVVHYVDRSVATETELSTEPGEEVSSPPSEQTRKWKWNARRYHAGNSKNSSDSPPETPSIREVTLRSMMGEYGGNAGLLSLWFDADPAVNEWKYQITMCAAGVQHIWWAVHVLGIVTLAIVSVWAALTALEAPCATRPKQRREVDPKPDEKKPLEHPNGRKKAQP